jgi:hypothetical protein
MSQSLGDPDSLKEYNCRVEAQRKGGFGKGCSISVQLKANEREQSPAK